MRRPRHPNKDTPPKLKLETWRRGYGVTREQLARLAHISTKVVTGIEEGTTTPRQRTIVSLADIFRVLPFALDRDPLPEEISSALYETFHNKPDDYP